MEGGSNTLAAGHGYHRGAKGEGAQSILNILCVARCSYRSALKRYIRTALQTVIIDT